MGIYDPLTGEISNLVAYISSVHTNTLFITFLLVYFGLFFFMIGARVPVPIIFVALLPIVLTFSVISSGVTMLLIISVFLVSAFIIFILVRLFN